MSDVVAMLINGDDRIAGIRRAIPLASERSGASYPLTYANVNGGEVLAARSLAIGWRMIELFSVLGARTSSAVVQGMNFTPSSRASRTCATASLRQSVRTLPTATSSGRRSRSSALAPDQAPSSGGI
jgi:hypothetical protein